MRRHFLFVSDFDRTLSFNDSGHVLSEMLGVTDFGARCAGLARLNLVQSGAELAYLLRHDPDFRRVRREHLAEVGRRIRLKRNIALLPAFLAHGIDGHRFELRVVSAAPEEVVHSALAGIVAPEHVVATRFGYNADGEIDEIVRVPAGYGKVAALEAMRAALGVPRDRVSYVGDGSSDIHVMLHVNRGEGLTIAASEARDVTEIARRTVISDDALSVLVPLLEEVVGCTPAQIRRLFEAHGVLIHEWDRTRTDWVTIRAGDAESVA